MNCHKVRANITIWLDKTADAKLSAAIEQHLKTCPQCQVIASQYKSIDQALSEMTNTAPDYLHYRLIERLQHSQGKKRSYRLSKLLQTSIATVVMVLSLYLGSMVGKNAESLTYNSQSVSNEIELGQTSLISLNGIGE